MKSHYGIEDLTAYARYLPNLKVWHDYGISGVSESEITRLNSEYLKMVENEWVGKHG